MESKKTSRGSSSGWWVQPDGSRGAGEVLLDLPVFPSQVQVEPQCQLPPDHIGSQRWHVRGITYFLICSSRKCNIDKHLSKTYVPYVVLSTHSNLKARNQFGFPHCGKKFKFFSLVAVIFPSNNLSCG